jgi:THO complex subunit 3
VLINRYFAVGSGDALVSLWDSHEVICLRTFGRIESAIRTISFTHDSQYIATGSEDLIIDIVRNTLILNTNF